MTVQAVPTGYHTVTPYLIVDDVERLIEYLETVFGAEVKERSAMPDGKVAVCTRRGQVWTVENAFDHPEKPAEWKALSPQFDANCALPV